MTMAGIISHLRWAEKLWFEVVFLGRPADGPPFEGPEDSDMMVAGSKRPPGTQVTWTPSASFSTVRRVTTDAARSRCPSLRESQRPVTGTKARYPRT
jgi:hypothetical protein